MRHLEFTVARMTSLSVWAILPVALSIVFAPQAFADRTVGPSGDYPTIQAALNAANPGEKITVSPGVYYEVIEFKNKDVVLTSTAPGDPLVVASTVIDGGRKNSVVSFGGAETPDCVLRGFTIRNGRALSGGGINVHGSEATIEYNVIKKNEAYYMTGVTDSGWGGGIYNSAGIIRHNTIVDNIGQIRGAGLCCCNREIAHNLIAYNHGKYGGGIAAFEQSDVNGWIHHNTIASNTNADHGGGLYECQARIEHNSILRNSVLGAGGGLSYCEGTIRYNTIWRNTTSATMGAGGGLYRCGWTHSSTLQRNTIWENESRTGGGLEQCVGTIEGNWFIGNIASVSGGGLAGPRGTMRNNVISGNKATAAYGGAIYAGEGEFINNTVVGNFADSNTGGLYKLDAEIWNCILWDNTGAQVVRYDASPLVINYTCIEGGSTAGTGNIGVAPDLVTIYGDDWHLQATSPCIDAGNPATSAQDECQPPGLSDARNDMGAYGGAHNCLLSANDPESITLLTPARKAVTNAMGSFVIQWQDADPDDDAVISLFYDTDDKGYDGLPLAGGLSEDDQTNQFTWVLDDVPEGEYWIYALIDDGHDFPQFTYASGSVYVESPFSDQDINQDRVVNAVDVQLVINDALGLAPPYDCDVNNDNVTNAVDIQMVINAALGVL